MKTKLNKELITRGFMVFLIFSSLCIALSWASHANTKIVKIKPSDFYEIVIHDFLKIKFIENFPKRPPKPVKDEFETSSEYKKRKENWENNYKKAVADLEEEFAKKAPIFEIYDLRFKFDYYNADERYFPKIQSERIEVKRWRPICEGHNIDVECFETALEYSTIISIKRVSIEREKAKELKSLSPELRMRVGFKLIPPFPRDDSDAFKMFLHHVSIYDVRTGKTLFTITDLPLEKIKHGE